MNSLSNQKIQMPKSQYALEMLSRLLTDKGAKELWNRACAYYGLEAANDIQSLEKVYNYLANEPGSVGVLGRSLSFKLRSYTISQRYNNG